MTRGRPRKQTFEKIEEVVDKVAEQLGPISKGYDLSEVMTEADVNEILDRANPKCGRGGCSHRRSMHYQGNDQPFECHTPECKCWNFIHKEK